MLGDDVLRAVSAIFVRHLRKVDVVCRYVHDSMAKVSNTIWETCKTYLFTQANSWPSSGC